jgi:hypothetical protein
MFGSVFIAGAALQWCRDNLHLFRDFDEATPLADSVEGSGGVVFVPAFAGLGAPYWLVFPHYDVKNRVDLNFRFDQPLTDLIDEYVQEQQVMALGAAVELLAAEAVPPDLRHQ